jgi:hypothetical protein
MIIPGNQSPNKQFVLLPLESKARQENQSVYFIYEGTHNHHSLEEQQTDGLLCSFIHPKVIAQCTRWFSKNIFISTVYAFAEASNFTRTCLIQNKQDN